MALVVSQAVLSGCAHQYLLKLDNGDQLLSYSKPKKQGTSYHYTGETGVNYFVPQNRVVKIKAVSVVKEEVRPVAPAKPQKPKRWFFLWLA